MKKAFFIVLAALLAGFTPVFAQTDTPLKVKMKPYSAKKCVRKKACVEINLSWPVLSGGNSQAVKAINDSIQKMVYIAVEADPAVPMPQALDTAMAYSYAMLKEQVGGMGGYDIGYFYELESTVLLNNGRYFSLSMNSFSFSGGAHPSTYAQIATYDLQTGRVIPLSEIILDTVAFRPLLEQKFIEEKTEPGQPAPTLAEILFQEPLDLPTNYAIVPEGVRFFYNPYEVAAYAFGPTDITLSWEQLGRLADRKKWQ